MNEDIFYPALLIIVGILVGTAVVILFRRISASLVRYFQFYSGSKGILKISLEFISWFSGMIVFLLFLRLALRIIGLDFTMQFVEQFLVILPNYVVATIIVLSGVYLSSLIRERAKKEEFEFKYPLLLLADFIINITFVLAALSHIGIDIAVFLELYKAILWSFALILALTVGIPAGLLAYNGIRKKPSRHK
jgi:hypothetical protein